MIIFDMEWNSGKYERVVLNEILQIGAVKLDRPGGPVLDTFNIYIRPQVHKRWSPPAEELPELELCKRSQVRFPEAAEAFFRWCGQGERFGVWGTADLAVLLENLRYWHIDPPPLDRFYDLQEAFAQTAGAKRQPALHHAVEYCALPEALDYHNAQNDAFYTALVSGYISPGALEESLRDPAQLAQRKRAKKPRLPKLADKSLGAPLWRGQRQGPFAEEAQMLNNRGCRLAACPVCGQKFRISSWYRRKDGEYLAKFSCGSHGAFLSRLVTGRDEDGRLWAAHQVLDRAGTAQKAFGEARRNGAIPCASGKSRKGKGRRHHRSRRRQTGGASKS